MRALVLTRRTEEDFGYGSYVDAPRIPGLVRSMFDRYRGSECPQQERNQPKDRLARRVETDYFRIPNQFLIKRPRLR
jgi:hypothetical protein